MIKTLVFSLLAVLPMAAQFDLEGRIVRLHNPNTSGYAGVDMFDGTGSLRIASFTFSGAGVSFPPPGVVALGTYTTPQELMLFQAAAERMRLDSAGNVQFSGPVLPKTGHAWNLGSLSNIWDKAYINNVEAVQGVDFSNASDSANTFRISAAAGILTILGASNPGALTGTNILLRTSVAGSGVNSPALEVFSDQSTGFYATAHPTTDGTIDLGRANLHWGNAYLKTLRILDTANANNEGTITQTAGGLSISANNLNGFGSGTSINFGVAQAGGASFTRMFLDQYGNLTLQPNAGAPGLGGFHIQNGGNQVNVGIDYINALRLGISGKTLWALGQSGNRGVFRLSDGSGVGGLDGNGAFVYADGGFFRANGLTDTAVSNLNYAIIGTVAVNTGITAGVQPGQSVTTTVRNAAGTGTCTIIYTFGIKVGGTC